MGVAERGMRCARCRHFSRVEMLENHDLVSGLSIEVVPVVVAKAAVHVVRLFTLRIDVRTLDQRIAID